MSISSSKAISSSLKAEMSLSVFTSAGMIKVAFMKASTNLSNSSSLMSSGSIAIISFSSGFSIFSSIL